MTTVPHQKDTRVRPCLVEMWGALARHARGDVRAAMRSSARAVSSSRRAGSAERPLAAAAAPSAESIAGANTSEYLVKVPASLEAGMDAAQSTTRSRLLTLTSVAAAGYLGYFIFPLVGGGTASSAVQMCASKDVIFRRAGVARLRAAHPWAGLAPAQRGDRVGERGLALGRVRRALQRKPRGLGRLRGLVLRSDPRSSTGGGGLDLHGRERNPGAQQSAPRLPE